MDDLASKLNAILTSEEGQAQLRDLAAMFGGEGGGNTPDLSSLLGSLGGGGDMPDLSALLGSLGGGEQKQQKESSEKKSGGFDFGGIDIETLLKIQSILSSMQSDDKNSELLLALRPHMQDKNKQKIDQAVKILKLLSLLPAIRESGLLGGDFFGL